MILVVIILLFGIYSVFRTIRHSKELQKAIKENRSLSNTMLRKENKRLIREMIIMIILLIIAILSEGDDSEGSSVEDPFSNTDNTQLC